MSYIRLFACFGLIGVSLISMSTLKAATTLDLQTTVATALKQNRAYLAAQQEVTKADNEIKQARAGAFPQLNFNANYSRSFLIPTFYLIADNETVSFKSGFKNNWDATVSLEQPIWQGGKVFSAYKIAKVYRKYADAIVAQTKSEVTYQAKLLFHAVGLAQARLDYLGDAVKAANENEKVTEQLFDKGMVPKYDLLRAQVEAANLQPQLLEAESDLTLAYKDLKSFLSIDLSEEIIVVPQPPAETSVSMPSLDSLMQLAMETRPEIRQSNYMTDMRKRAIRVAQGDHYPSLSAFSSYTWQAQSDEFSMSDNNSRSASAGLTLRIPIFSGGRTSGEVGIRKADYAQAKLAERDTEDMVRLEVEQAHDRLTQTVQSLVAVRGTVEQAEEAYRIAKLRFESGMGTQLEVLSSQAALTQARTIAAQAEFNYNKAQAELAKATGQE